MSYRSRGGFSFVFCFFLFSSFSISRAQNIQLKTGQMIEAKGVRRSGDMLMGGVQVGSSTGEVGYQISTIARIDFPEPPQFKTTEAFLTQGAPAKALAEIEPVVKFQEPFRNVPGNFWAQAALLKVSALAGMQLDKQAESLGEEIRKNSTDPETARAAQLQVVASLIHKEDYAKAIALCDAVIKESAKPSVLAEAWVKKGDALLAQRTWDDAVLAYLHVPVFYQDEKLWMPPALLGSSRAFRGLEDLDRAKKSLNDLTAQFPKSAQADLARTELKKLAK
ncbi:MAG: tetratricopeptide repeat protein [Chthoniobacterales bacterium]|nr:tetratricopeptide repeat protein [Chthoniobacterales bacterium]